MTDDRQISLANLQKKKGALSDANSLGKIDDVKGTLLHHLHIRL